MRAQTRLTKASVAPEPNTLPRELLAAIAEAVRIVEDRARLRETRAALERELPIAQAAVEAARERLGDAGTDGDEIASATALSEFRERRDFAEVTEARIAGIGRKLAATETQLASAEQALRSEVDRFSRQVFDDYKSEYEQALAAFASVVRRGIGLALALGREAPGLNETAVFRDPMELRLFEILPRDVSGGQVVPRPLACPEIAAAMEPYAAVTDAVKLLNRERRQIDNHRGYAAKAIRVE